VLLPRCLPIAIAANILRVTALVLITVHFGEEAAMGFVHGLAGLLSSSAALGDARGYRTE
jgi:exosortase/archaeosortase family protein